MTKKATYILIALLVIANIILAIALMRSGSKPSKGHNRHDRPKEVITKSLQLDDKQKVLYDSMVTVNQEDIKEIRDNIKQLKQELYAHASDDNFNSDSLLRLIGNSQIEADRVFFEHFRDIRGILHEDQYPKYQELETKVSKIFAPSRPPGK